MIGRRPWMRYRSRGLGAACANGSYPSTTWENWFGCYPTKIDTTFSSAVSSALNPNLPAMSQPPAVGAPTNLTTAPASGTEASQTVNALLKQQMENWQAQNRTYFANVAAAQGAATGGDGAALDCTNAWTYYTNSACPADCSRFWTNLTNSSCPGILGGGIASSLIMPLAIAAGVLLLVVVIRR